MDLVSRVLDPVSRVLDLLPHSNKLATIHHESLSKLNFLWSFKPRPKLYIPSTLNMDLILWHTKLIVCAENVKSWFKSWFFPFTFQAYTLPHTLNCMCVGLFEFHIVILEQF